MPQLETLGNLLTCGLALFAAFFVPIKLARIWFPVVRDKIIALFMSRDAEPAARAADTEAVHVPVPGTDTAGSTAAPALDITGDYEMPRIGRRLNDHEIVALLAAQKGSDGSGYRFSGNQIYELVKGPRADVLRQIKEVREGPSEPTYRQYTANEQAVLQTNGHAE